MEVKGVPTQYDFVGWNGSSSEEKEEVTEVALDRIYQPNDPEMILGFVKNRVLPIACSSFAACALVTCALCTIIGVAVLLDYVLFAPFGHLLLHKEWSFSASQDEDFVHHIIGEGLFGTVVGTTAFMLCLVLTVPVVMLVTCGIGCSIEIIREEYFKYVEAQNSKKELP